MSDATIQTATEAPPPAPRLSGAERVAVLMLCLGEKAGADLMRDLDEVDIRSVTRAMFALPALDPEPVQSILDEFSAVVTAGGAALGSVETARSLLSSFLPPEKVEEFLRQHAPPRVERDPWRRLGKMEGEALTDLLSKEHPQTVAVILSNVPAAAVARALPHMARERMHDVVERMACLGALPEALLDEIERAVREDLLATAEGPAVDEVRGRLADVLSALDPDLLEGLTAHLESRAPNEYDAVRRHMFTFDDLLRIELRDLGRVIREAPSEAIPLALSGARDDVREHLLNALPARARAMIEEDIGRIGKAKAADVRAAQNELVDCTKALIRSGEVASPEPVESGGG
jgi:flagellar motor switch protein FliG